MSSGISCFNFFKITLELKKKKNVLEAINQAIKKQQHSPSLPKLPSPRVSANGLTNWCKSSIS